jgi:hypothetical protein
MNTETTFGKEVHLAVGSRPGVTLFRNNTAMAWAGKVIRSYKNGSKEIANAFPLRAGLCNGSSDYVGFVTMEITPDMVGKKVAVFTALETKTLTGEERIDQERFIKAVRRAGGIAGFVRSIADAIALVTSRPQ